MSIFSRVFLVLYRLLHTVYIVVILAIIIALFSLHSLLKTEKVVVKDGSFLVIAPNGALLEQRRAPLFSKELQGESYVKEVVKTLKIAATDKKIKGVLLDFSSFSGASAASIAEVGRAIKHFSDTDKPLIAYSSSYTMGSYLLSSGAKEIWLDPMGEVALNGLAMQNIYFKDAMDRFGIKAYISRTGPFKSAVEPYIANHMSDENRAVTYAYLDDTWSWVKATIAINREVESNFINTYATQRSQLLATAGGNSAKLALDYQLIDQIGSKEDLKKAIKTSHGGELDINYIDYLDYLSSRGKENDAKKGDQIAIIYATGSIYNGSANPGMISGHELAALIRAVTDDQSVVSIVLRVDTGGGDAYASELIYRAIADARQVKPVLISMAGMAASGGYWFSLAANEIWAEEATLTGSIGVFSYFLNMSDLINKYGFTVDGVATSNSAYQPSLLTVPTDEFLELMNQGVAYTYQNFLQRVVDAGRASSLAEANRIAEGRIYSGRKAKELGLVDEIGGLDKVIARAAQLAASEKYYTKIYENLYSPLELTLEKALGVKLNYSLPLNQLMKIFDESVNNQAKMLLLEPMDLTIN